MKYDDASWHYGGDFPKDLPNEAGATHTGTFVAWALLAGLAGEIHTTESPEDLRDLQSRTVTPGHFFMTRCDGKFSDEDLTDEGNEFAEFYYRLDTPDRFLADYEKTLAKTEPSLYHIEDSWANFDLLKPVFDERLAVWRARKRAE
jgi:hypothetical protein